MERLNGEQGRIYLNLSFHPTILKQMGDSRDPRLLRDKMVEFLDHQALKHGFHDFYYKATEPQTASANRAGLQTIVRQHDALQESQAKGLAYMARSTFHNLKRALGWSVCCMEKRSTRTTH